MRARGYLVLFTLALIWGASFLFIKIAVNAGVPPATLVVIRLSFSVATLGAIVLVRPRLMAGWWRYWWLAILVAVFSLALPFSLISWGETQITSGIASILDATMPIFTVLLASLPIGAGHERLTLGRVLGVLVGFLGVGVVVGVPVLEVAQQQPWVIAGEFAVVAASASYAIGALLAKRYDGSAPLVGPLTAQATALIFEIPVALNWEPPTVVPPPEALAAIAVLGIFGTGIAYLLYFWLIRNAGPSSTSLVTYLLPCTAVLWGRIFLGEPVAWNALAGLGLVLAGTMLATGTLNGLFRRRGRKPHEIGQPVETGAEQSTTITNIAATPRG